MKRLVLVDGNALLHRAYHATPPLTTAKGELINAVYGFTSMLLRSINDLKPDYIAVAWDEKGPTFRHQIYNQYKATRGPKDDGLSSQYGRVFEVVQTLNIPEFKLSGYEADDLIGTLARHALRQAQDFDGELSRTGKQEKDQIEVIILTGDRDIMQIIEKNIKVLMPKKTLQDVGLYGEEEFVLRFGFSPIQLIEYKALAGDASDNIPGVSGIGEVTATKLIHQFGDIEHIYLPENLKTLPERTQKLLAEGAEDAVLSKKLATLELNVPIKLDLEKCKVHDYDHQKAIQLFEELQFKSLIAKLPGNGDKGFAGTRQDLSTLPPSVQEGAITDLDLAVTPVLEKMTKTGIKIDLNFLEKMGKELKEKLVKLEKDIYASVGHEFNINSPKQLAEILFDELNLPVIRKTKTGRSTDEATLTELTPAHPVILFLLDYRQLFKLVSTYVDTLPKFADKQSLAPDGTKTGRVHSTFNVEGAATGRLSSKDPNLQNIPIKGQMGGEIRKAFIAEKGKVIFGADYSQIELRIMAHLADDPGLKKAFQEGLDIHSLTASKIFKIPVEEVSKQQRNVGKTMNFATLYGQGPHALSRQLGIDYETARTYIAEYFEQFPKIKEWMQKTLEEATQKGYVQTLWGRKRYIPELQATNKGFKAAGERAAVNHPVQGTAADMIKKAMVEIEKELSAISHQSSRLIGKADSEHSEWSESCKLILQVHDELLFEVDPKYLNEIAKMVKEKMENALKLSVPVVVDLKVGSNWGEMEKIVV